MKDWPVLMDWLRDFPHIEWGEEPTPRWLQLIANLQAYTPPESGKTMTNPLRKWECVSAVQKSIRRGFASNCYYILSLLSSLPENDDRRYVSTRIAATSCEDVGPGDQELVNFIIALYAIVTPSMVSREQLYTVWCWTVTQLAEAQKSRVFCQYYAIDKFIHFDFVTPLKLDTWEKEVLRCLQVHNAHIVGDPVVTSKQAWAYRCNWRGDRMLKYQAYQMPVQLGKDYPLRDLPYKFLGGLPSYCYDMHTRPGKAALRALATYGPVRDFFKAHPTKLPPSEALGWPVFFMEGAQIEGRLYDARLDVLEYKFFAEYYGWHLATWYELLNLVERMRVENKLEYFRQYAIMKSGVSDVL